MTDDHQPIPRLPTGIPGLDELLEGGLLTADVYILRGPPGAGKTIFGNQLCFYHAAEGTPVVYLTLLAESHSRMLEHLRRMQFFRADLIPSKLYYVSAFKTLEEDGLPGLLEVVRKLVTSRKARLLVLDGLVSAEESARTDRDYKKFVHQLQVLSTMTECTTLLLSSTDDQRAIRPELTMVDGIFELSEEQNRHQTIRRLRVRKLRGASHVRGVHTVDISDAGITVIPRLETQLSALGRVPAPEPDAGRLGFGVAELDAMLHGGLPASTMTMVLGPSGSGKTILCAQFLADGAARGERCLHFGFYERPEAMVVKGDRIGIDLRSAEDSGLLTFLWQPPVEGVVDILGARLLRAVRERKVRRLVIDGMHGFLVATDAPERVHDMFATLADKLQREGVTTLYTMDEAAVMGISALTHNIILLRHVERNAGLHRLISILKMRESDYEPAIRELRITEQGITVAKGDQEGAD